MKSIVLYLHKHEYSRVVKTPQRQYSGHNSSLAIIMTVGLGQYNSLGKYHCPSVFHLLIFQRDLL